MGHDIVRIEVHKNLQDVLENLRSSVAKDMKNKYQLEEITIPRTLSSQILAAKLKGQKSMEIKVRKTGPKKGYLDLL